MKNCIITLIALIICSCSNTTDPNLIIGHWKMNDVENNTGIVIVDTMSFFKNDSITMVGYCDGKLNGLSAGHYKIDWNSKSLTIFLDTAVSKDITSGKANNTIKKSDHFSHKFKIIKLNTEELEIQSDSSKIISRYARY